MMHRLAVPLVLALIAGCAGSRDSFNVSVKNETDDPLTVWLTSQGGGKEWKSPEELAKEPPRKGEKIPGMLVPPGKTATVGPVRAGGGEEISAFLRIYRGDKNLSELLEMTRGSPDRLDVPLDRGSNYFIVSESEGKLRAVNSTPPATTHP